MKEKEQDRISDIEALAHWSKTIHRVINVGLLIMAVHFLFNAVMLVKLGTTPDDVYRKMIAIEAANQERDKAMAEDIQAIRDQIK